MATVFDLIRHGEPQGGSRYRGHGIDDPLTDNGWRQMWSAVGADRQWDRVVTSPMARCREFAAALARERDLPVGYEDRLKEVGFGWWEGKRRDEVRALDPDGYEAFYADPVHSRPAGAEPLEQFCRRVSGALYELAERHADEHLLLVTHAGVVRAAVSHALQAPLINLYRIRVGSAQMTRLRCDERGLALDFVNGCRPSLD